jgi:organic hydroperoxide reductase OsmC/OhrA
MARPRTDYRVELRPDGTLVTEREGALELPKGWTPEHLLLAALTRCSLHSLAYHAERACLEATGSGTATGSIDRRPNGDWGFVAIGCELEISVSPSPEGEALLELLDRAERGCFVGASLEPRPAYRWRVNGVHVR